MLTSKYTVSCEVTPSVTKKAQVPLSSTQLSRAAPAQPPKTRYHTKYHIRVESQGRHTQLSSSHAAGKRSAAQGSAMRCCCAVLCFLSRTYDKNYQGCMYT